MPIIPATPTNKWRHVVITGRSGESKVYLDGDQLGSTVGSVYGSIAASDNVTIGQGHQNGRWFRGNIDEVAIYDHVLAEERIFTHFLAGGAGQVDPDPEPDNAELLAHWTFDEDASDSVGGHDGSLEGGANITDDAAVGAGALDLRDVNGYVDVPTAALDGESSFSVAMFVSVDALDHACCSGLLTNDSWAPGKLHVNVATASGVPEAAVNGNPPSAWGRDASIPTDGSWVHLAFTYDGASGTMTPYIDGVAGNAGTGGTALAIGDGPITIGGWDTTGGDTQDRFLDGRIDDLRLYSGVLTPEQVGQLAVPEPSASVLAILALVWLSGFGPRRRRNA